MGPYLHPSLTLWFESRDHSIIHCWWQVKIQNRLILRDTVHFTCGADSCPIPMSPSVKPNTLLRIYLYILTMSRGDLTGMMWKKVAKTRKKNRMEMFCFVYMCRHGWIHDQRNGKIAMELSIHYFDWVKIFIGDLQFSTLWFDIFVCAPLWFDIQTNWAYKL